MSACAIETRALTMTYGKSRGIDSVDLSVSAGEVFGFLGPNGAGKTTTIRVLLDLLRPTSGTASVLGLDCQASSLEVRRRVGYLPGDLKLHDHLDGWTLVEWFSGIRGEVDPAVVSALVDRFSIEMNRPSAALSKGNRQKLGLLQAFMHEPEVLILDEPTVGLDPLMQAEFHTLVREAAAAGRTVFLSSHQLDEVGRVADRVGIIRQGRMVAVESVESMRNRALRRVEIRFAEFVTPDVFTALAGVSGVEVDGVEVDGSEMKGRGAGGTNISMSVGGTLDQVIKAASRFTVVDFLSEPADLEDMFLAYYDTADDQPEQHS